MPNLQLDTFSLVFLGLGGVVFGLAEVFLSLTRRIPAWMRSLSLGCCLLLVSAAAWAMDGMAFLSMPSLMLAVVAGLLTIIRLPHKSLKRAWPAVQSCLVIAAGGVLLSWQLLQIDQNTASSFEETDRFFAQFLDPISPDAVPAFTAYTDLGNSVPLFTATDQTPISRENEESYLRDQKLHLKLIQTGTPDNNTNCHGWVFTGGRYWLKGAQVDPILKDNGYEATTTPTVGDVAIYRSISGEVMHTALVRSTTPDGQLFLESKWGRLGRYLHTTDQHPYRVYTVTYYHNIRSTHLLRGLTSDTTPKSQPLGY